MNWMRVPEWFSDQKTVFALWTVVLFVVVLRSQTFADFWEHRTTIERVVLSLIGFFAFSGMTGLDGGKPAKIAPAPAPAEAEKASTAASSKKKK